MTAVPARACPPVFTQGSTMRHVAVMTATGSIGIIAIFAVDFLSLFWVSRLGVQTLKAAVGYASQLQFLAMSVNIGFTIAISAVCSRALGAGDRPRARRLAASGLLITGLASVALTALLLAFRDQALSNLLHARGEAASVASGYLAIALPANVPLALGMALSGVLRAAGDARRAMYVTLSGAIITAGTDPALIFGLGLGVYGAAWATVISRLVFLAVGLYGAVAVHDLVGKPRLRGLKNDAAAIMTIGAPAILANLATPVASVYLTRIWSDFGDAAVAGGAIVDRVVPLAGVDDERLGHRPLRERRTERVADLARRGAVIRIELRDGIAGDQLPALVRGTDLAGLIVAARFALDPVRQRPRRRRRVTRQGTRGGRWPIAPRGAGHEAADGPIADAMLKRDHGCASDVRRHAR